MNTRFLSFTLAALLSAPGLVLAQDARPARGADGPPGRFNPAERVKTMTASLELTAEQQAKFQAVFEKNLPVRKKIFADGTLSAEQRQTQVRALLKAEMDELNPLLTPEQQEKWKKAATKPAPGSIPEAKPSGAKKDGANAEKKTADEKTPEAK